MLVDHSAFQAWGWRIPFLFSLPLGAVGVCLRQNQVESPRFQPAQHRVRVLRVLAEHSGTVRRSLLIAGAYSAALSVWFLFLPSYLTGTGTASFVKCLTAARIGLIAAAVAAPVFGRLSDAVVRRPVLMSAATALAVTAVPTYLWVSTGSMTAMIMGNVVIGVIISAFVLPAFLSGQFPTAVRATGLGLAYGIGSAVIGGTALLVATVLARSEGVVAVPVYLGVWAVAALVAIVRSPETAPRKIAFHRAAREPSRRSPGFTNLR